MADDLEHERNKATSGGHEGTEPRHQGGDQPRKTQQWGGGSKASKGPVTEGDKNNPNSSAKT
jgi:hypothetical protein